MEKEAEEEGTKHH